MKAISILGAPPLSFSNKLRTTSVNRSSSCVATPKAFRDEGLLSVGWRFSGGDVNVSHDEARRNDFLSG